MVAKLVKIIVLVLCLTMTVPQVGYAQAPGPGAQVEAPISGTRKQLATIIFAGLAGAILGLSTLSFHGRPQEKLSNIAVGFALGIIGGTVYTTYRAARAPYDVYDYGFEELMLPDDSEFKMQPEQIKPTLAYSWTF